MSVQRQIDKLIAYQAAEWYENTKDGRADDNREFVRWICESPRHLEAFIDVASQAGMIRKAFAAESFDLNRLLQKVSPNVSPLPVKRLRGVGILTANFSKPAKLWSAAVALAAVTASALFYYRVASWQHFETPVGEQRTIQLAEGSVVSLNTRSRVDVRFSQSRRDIRLLDGEATFKVSQDRMRPFRVHTRGTVVEAVGTQFNVYARPDGSTTISVLEGKVKVSREGPAGIELDSPSVPLTAGEEIQVRSAGPLARAKIPDVAETIAWQQRKLVFKRSSLEEMAAEFNRYNKGMQIRLEGIEPGAFRFSGAFNADDPQSLAVLLMREPDLAVERREGEILIRSRGNPP